MYDFAGVGYVIHPSSGGTSLESRNRNKHRESRVKPKPADGVHSNDDIKVPVRVVMTANEHRVVTRWGRDGAVLAWVLEASLDRVTTTVAQSDFADVDRGRFPFRSN
jgi:hypothetical protein